MSKYYTFKCPKCTAQVGLLPRKGDLPPFTPTCNNDEAHHHRRGELMQLASTPQSSKKRSKT